jgi:hypothetical protein
MRRNRLFSCFLTGLLAVIIIFAGCGKKGDPIPPRIKLPIVTDLTTVSVPEGIVLNWSLEIRADGIAGFKILRSMMNRGEDACPGCPQDYRPFREVALADERLHRMGAIGFRYIDTDVRGGSFYSYRIAVCNRTGNCGEASNEAGVIHTGK